VVKSIRVVSSVGRASALHAECRQFEPVTTHQIAAVAQLVEHHVANVNVIGSNPISRSKVLQQRKKI